MQCLSDDFLFDCLSDILHSAFFYISGFKSQFFRCLKFFEKSVDNGIFRAMIYVCYDR